MNVRNDDTVIRAQSANRLKRGRCLPYCLLLAVTLMGAGILSWHRGAGLPAAPPRTQSQWSHLYGRLPLSFEANRGQTDPQVAYISRGRGYALFLTRSEAVLTLKNSSPLRMQLLRADTHAVVSGMDPLPGRSNYFIGNDPGKWHTNVPTYAKVKYQSVYPGIDLVYYGTQNGQLEYDFVVAPGADPGAIGLGITAPGSAPLQINAEGDLVAALPGGSVQLHKPVVYQETGSEVRGPNSDAGNRKSSIENRKFVEGHYVLEAQNQVRFSLGAYDRTRPLVIDPELVYATFVGGGGGDAGFAITVDANFDATIAGVTNSTNFPTLGGEQGASRGNGDCFITKINSAGTKLIYSTYLGGSGSDTCTALTLGQGSPFVTGYTTSTDFPTKAPAGPGTPEPYQLNYAGNTDAFVTELSSDGSSITYSTYLGGSGLDYGQGIAVDATGEAYVVGTTQSNDFPVKNPFQANNAGGNDVFLAKLDITGENLLYSTYLGGTSLDVAQAVLLDSSSNVYITGYTQSTDFPTASPLQSNNAGATDAFITKMNVTSTTSSLVFSTYLGGSGDDRAFALALDASKNIYVAGSTTSTNLPGAGLPQPSLKGASDAFVAKVNSAGSSLLYSTYLGGSGVDIANGIAVGPAGEVYITGSTQSTDFPTQNPIQSVLGINNNQNCQSAPTPAPCADAFVAEINATGNGLTYSTYLGGNGYDAGQGIALGTNNDVYITGTTASSNFPVASQPVAGSLYTAYVAPFKSTLGGSSGNAFIAAIDPGNTPNISISPTTINFGNETIAVASAIQPVQIFNPSTAPLVISSIVVTPLTVTQQGTNPNVFLESDNCVGTISPGNFCTINLTFTPNALGPISDTIQIFDNASGTANTQQQINVSGSGVTAATAVTVLPSSLSFTSQQVGTQSPPQTVTITNTGTQTLSITGISTSGSSDFSQTNTCSALQDTLAVGQSCTVSVVFNPASSGNRSGGLQISDNAVGSPQSVLLTGIGAAAFTLTSLSSSCSNNTATNPVIIGSTQASFCVVAKGPTSFNGAITLSCSTGSTCNFSPNPIFAGGQGSTLTISNLTTGLSNPYPFTVTGTSGTQSTTVLQNLEFEDFALTASPTNFTLTAGNSATYSVFVNPLFGFNSQVHLYVTSNPADTNAFFDNSDPTPNGTSASKVTLTIATSKFIPSTTRIVPRFPGGRLPPIILGLLSLAALASLAFGNKRRHRHGWLGTHWMAVRAAALCLILVLDLGLVACRPQTLVNSGTPVGNYPITINAWLVSNTAVIRSTQVTLSVTATPTCTSGCTQGQ